MMLNLLKERFVGDWCLEDGDPKSPIPWGCGPPSKWPNFMAYKLWWH